MDQFACCGKRAVVNFLAEDLGSFVGAAHEDRSEFGIELAVGDNYVCISVNLLIYKNRMELTVELEPLSTIQDLRIAKRHNPQFV